MYYVPKNLQLSQMDHFYLKLSQALHSVSATSATFGPMTMFKQQLLSFHVASKTLHPKLLCFYSKQHASFPLPLPLLFYTVLHTFNPEMTEANTILKKILLQELF